MLLSNRQRLLLLPWAEPFLFPPISLIITIRRHFSKFRSLSVLRASLYLASQEADLRLYYGETDVEDIH